MPIYLSIFAIGVGLALCIPGRTERIRRTPIRTAMLVSFTAILVLFAGLRYNTGFDYGSYLNNWWEPAQNFSNIIIHQKEPFLFLFFHLMGTLSLSYQSGLLVVGLISLGVKVYVFHRYSPYPFLSLLILIGDFYLMQEMGQMRSGLAMAFLTLAFHFYLQNKQTKSFVLYGVACFTHLASIPFFIFYVVSRMRLPPSPINLTVLVVGVPAGLYFITGLAVTALAGTTAGQIIGISSYTVRVLEGVESRSLLTAGTLFTVLVLVVSSALRTRLIEKRPYVRELLWLYAIGLAFILSSTFLGDPAARIARMFLFYQCLLIPILITALRPKMHSFILIFGLAATYSLLKFMLVLTSRQDSFIPYQMAPFS